MKSLRLLPAALLAAGALLSISPEGRVGITTVQAQVAVKPEIAKPLKAAADLMRAGKFKEALAKVREADAVPNKNAAEQLTIERARGSAALGARDYDTAARAFEKVLDSGKLPASEQAQIAQALASAEYSAGHYAKAIQWARQAGNSPQMRDLIAAASFQTGDFASVAKMVGGEIEAAEKAGRRPEQRDLELYINAQQRLGSSKAVMSGLEKLLAYYPSKDTWANVLSRLPRKPGFSDRFSIDVYRLRLATGNLDKADDYMEAAQIALQERLPAEGKKIVDKGFEAKVLGTGAEAERQKRLLDLAAKREAEQKASIEKQVAEAEAAKDGNELVQLGYAYVTMGQADKGIELMQKGIAKGGLKHPEEAKLHLGLAQLQAGQKAKALQTLRGVRGDNGAADIAHLWVIHANQRG